MSKSRDWLYRFDMEIPEEDLSRVYALTPHQQLTYWIGAIAQNDVALEMTVFRLAGNAVLAPGMSRSDLPRDFERLREAVKSIVKTSRLPENLKTDAVAALGRAKIVHRSRVELVHDLWGLVEASRPAEFIVMDALRDAGGRIRRSLHAPCLTSRRQLERI